MVALSRIVWVIVFLLGAQGAWAAVTAKFDRDTIRINETARLQVQSDDISAAGEPDLSGLSEHFRILGQSSGQNISIVNGQQSATRTWTLELEPKSVGSFSIDPIAVGNQSTGPMRISVLPETSSPPGVSDVFIEVEADTDAVYVQQQLRVTARIFVGVPVVDASVSDPAPDNAVVRRLGADRNYTTQRGGRDYRVFERRYAVFPQASGPLEIPPLRFQGVVDETGLGGRGFGSLFNRGKRVRARSNAVGVMVNPPVSLEPGDTWLPAQQLTIHDLSEPVDSFRVGEPVTLKLQLQAQGLTAEQLPEIELPQTDGLRLYPDQAEKETLDDENNVVGILLNRIALIPQQAGELVIPGVTLRWWNVHTDAQETATLPPRTVQVTPAAAGSNAATESPAPSPINLSNDVASDDTATIVTEASGFWKWLAITSMSLWVVTVSLILFRLRRNRSFPQKPAVDSGAQESATRHALKAACRSDDAATASRLLREWGRHRWQREVTLDELGGLTGDSALTQAVEQLNRHLYAQSGGDTDWSGESLWAALDATVRRTPRLKETGRSSLEALYPD